MEEQIEIKMDKFFEFEFDEYSVFYNKESEIWFLETLGDEESSLTIILEDEKTSFEQSKKELKGIEFSEEDFDRLKYFVSKAKK